MSSEEQFYFWTFDLSPPQYTELGSPRWWERVRSLSLPKRVRSLSLPKTSRSPRTHKFFGLLVPVYVWVINLEERRWQSVLVFRSQPSIPRFTSVLGVVTGSRTPDDSRRTSSKTGDYLHLSPTRGTGVQTYPPVRAPEINPNLPHETQWNKSPRVTSPSLFPFSHSRTVDKGFPGEPDWTCTEPVLRRPRRHVEPGVSPYSWFLSLTEGGSCLVSGRRAKFLFVKCLPAPSGDPYLLLQKCYPRYWDS